MATTTKRFYQPHGTKKEIHLPVLWWPFFFKSHVWDQTLQQEGPLWHRDNSIIWHLWQERKLVLWGVSEFIAENTRSTFKKKIEQVKIKHLWLVVGVWEWMQDFKAKTLRKISCQPLTPSLDVENYELPTGYKNHVILDTTKYFSQS